jgi:hypothetical protein
MNTKPLTGARGLQALANFKVEKSGMIFAACWEADDFRYHIWLDEAAALTQDVIYKNVLVGTRTTTSLQIEVPKNRAVVERAIEMAKPLIPVAIAAEEKGLRDNRAVWAQQRLEQLRRDAAEQGFRLVPIEDFRLVPIK